MDKIFLVEKPIRGMKGLSMWECPTCKTIMSTFSKNGRCQCGEKVDFLNMKTPQIANNVWQKHQKWIASKIAQNKNRLTPRPGSGRGFLLP